MFRFLPYVRFWTVSSSKKGLKDINKKFLVNREISSAVVEVEFNDQVIAEWRKNSTRKMNARCSERQ